jgi:hypothetical protein
MSTTPHVESSQHVLLRCEADLLTCTLRRNLLELIQAKYSTSVPLSSLSNDQAITFLLSIIFHGDTIPRTLQFVYLIYCTLCGNGCSDPVDVVPEDPCTLAEDVDSNQDCEQIDE